MNGLKDEIKKWTVSHVEGERMIWNYLTLVWHLAQIILWKEVCFLKAPNLIYQFKFLLLCNILHQIRCIKYGLHGNEILCYTLLNMKSLLLIYLLLLL